MRKKIVAANWKMNKTIDEGIALANAIEERLAGSQLNAEVVLIPSFVHLTSVKEVLADSQIKLGAQNCHTKDEGAFTGEVSANMLQSIGLTHCLVGHSERRLYNREDEEELSAKLSALLSKGITPIYCCGEQLEDRQSGIHFDKVAKQLEVLWALGLEDFNKLVIAYEPVWAIGTGETATASQAQEMHAFIRQLISDKRGKESAANTSILYGGSCNASNAAELFSNADVDGGLIGGASLKSEDFISIVNAF